MSGYRRAHCRRCGGHKDRVGRISKSGLCADCGVEAFHESCTSHREHAGDTYAKWRAGMRKSIAELD